jgi:hypothetical protein
VESSWAEVVEGRSEGNQVAANTLNPLSGAILIANRSLDIAKGLAETTELAFRCAKSGSQELGGMLDPRRHFSALQMSNNLHGPAFVRLSIYCEDIFLLFRTISRCIYGHSARAMVAGLPHWRKTARRGRLGTNAGFPESVLVQRHTPEHSLFQGDT